MDSYQVKVMKRWVTTAILLVYLSYSTEAWNTEYEYIRESGSSSHIRPHIMTLERQRREAAPVDAAVSTTTLIPPPSSSMPLATVNANTSLPADDSNRTINKSSSSQPTAAVVTVLPMLGVNGSGIRHDNLTGNMPKVSDPIDPDDGINITVMEETPEMIKAEHNLTSLTIDGHEFYNSTFIGNVNYFKEHWANITAPTATIHNILSHSHRRAASMNVSFPFPFYGHNVTNITLATGGFIYTGDHVHNWLAATQYIAPLMANFDTTLRNDSLVSYSDDGEKFTVFWQNVVLQENVTQPFTFACTLYRNGDIVFAYKNIPIRVQDVNETRHPVKVGISDAYMNDRIVFYVRRKTIYEYHRINFKDHDISNNTILKLTALPTCMQYDNCQSCLNHNTAFNCTWCTLLNKCSSGTDKNKQDWIIRSCDRRALTNVSMCPPKPAPTGDQNASVAYDDGRGPYSDPVVHAFNPTPSGRPRQPGVQPTAELPVARMAQPAAHSSVGGAVAAFVCVALVCSLAAWTVYAFRNPHTRSGQLLIKYRPSQWNWRRGEARYTAATIHM